MNIRKPIILGILKMTGSKIPSNLKTIKQLEKNKEKEYQENKLKKLLIYSYNNVPYYNKVLEEAGVVKENKVFLEHFNKIPVLTKEIIRREGKNLHTKEKRRGVYENTSGGSTGEPARFMQDTYYNDWNIANKIYYKLRAGQDIGQRELRFWGSERDLLEGRESLKIRLRNWLYNRKEFNTFKMSEKDMHEFVNKWNKYEPTWVEAYVQSIYEFAKFIEKNNLKIKTPKNGILTSAGTLHMEMKNKIEKVFKCKVYNRYGSREVGDIACTDKTNKGLRISTWNQHIELTPITTNKNKKNTTNKNNKDNNEKSELKKILITNLNNKAMPIIRYDIGDIAEQNKQNKKYLKTIKGRENSIIKTEKGTFDGTALTTSFYGFKSIKKYQLIQKTKKDFILKLVLENAKTWHKEKSLLEKKLHSLLGKNINLNIKEVKDIPPLKSGKYQYIISEVK